MKDRTGVTREAERITELGDRCFLRDAAHDRAGNRPWHLGLRLLDRELAVEVAAPHGVGEVAPGRGQDPGPSLGDRELPFLPTPAEQAEFTELCRRLIERNYADPKLYKKAEKVEYEGASVDGDEGEVKTIVSYKTEESTIDYQLKKVGDNWLIYDMVIDDLSIAKNNRSQFRREIRKSSYEGLVKKLKDKLEKQDAEGQG